MKKISDKWKGMRVTLNYFGESNNKFGLKKKKVLLEEDKMQPLSVFRKTSNTKFQRLKKNKLSIDYMMNSELMKYNNNLNNNNFELIKIQDYEKAKNINFFNYFKNVKYFNRINSFKRNLSSSTLSMNHNSHKSFFKFEENLEDINKKKKEPKIKSKIGLKFDNINKKKKEFRLSKIDINKIITNYIQEYKNDIHLFNQKNMKINNKMEFLNHLKLNSKLIKHNNKSALNKRKENINMNSNNSNRRNNFKSSINRSSSYLTLRESENEINSNYFFRNKLFNLKYNLENKTSIGKAIIISKKNFFYNNLKPNKERGKLFMRKNNSFIDASTNTDFYPKK
jgi:hypothetical protein